MFHLKKIILIISLITFSQNVFSIGVKTLDTTLSGTDKSHFLENIWTFTSGDDYAKGFVTFDDGIELMSTGSTYTVDIGITGQINDTIFLGGNTLRLTTDLQLGRLVRVSGPGWIDCNGHTLKLGPTLHILASTVHIFASASAGGGGSIQGVGSSVRFFAPLMLGTSTALTEALSISNVRFLLDTASLITRDTAVYFWNDVDFIISSGLTVDFRGGFFVLENGGLRFFGSGATVNRVTGAQFFAHLSGTAFYELGEGLTYITNVNNFKSGSADNKFILNNATYISNGASTTFNGPISFEIKGKSKIGSINGGTVRFNDTANLRIFPGSTLEVDDRTSLKL